MMENVKAIVEEMTAKGINHTYPNSHDIEEIIIDEEGTVFVLPVVGEEIMLPQYVEAVAY